LSALKNKSPVTYYSISHKSAIYVEIPYIYRNHGQLKALGANFATTNNSFGFTVPPGL